MWRDWFLIRQLKLIYLRFVRLRGEAEEIAEGMALGIFIGMTPTFGFQMALAVLAAALVKKNKIAAALGVWITNPLTAPFIYAAEYEFARCLLGWERLSLPDQFSINQMLKLGWEVMVPLWLGSLVFGVVTAVAAYFVTLKMVPIAKSCPVPRWPRARRRTNTNSKR